ncbi:MAG: L-rhamnose mutarotase [Pseudomonadota bacterium]
MSATALRRQCFALDLKDDAAAIESYKHWHRPGGPPAEVTRALRAAGIAALDIYLVGNRLFMVMDSGEDFAAVAEATDNSDSPHVRDWETLMSELQQDLPFPQRVSPAGKWQIMEHIYSLTAQP